MATALQDPEQQETGSSGTGDDELDQIPTAPRPGSPSDYPGRKPYDEPNNVDIANQEPTYDSPGNQPEGEKQQPVTQQSDNQRSPWKPWQRNNQDGSSSPKDEASNLKDKEGSGGQKATGNATGAQDEERSIYNPSSTGDNFSPTAKLLGRLLGTRKKKLIGLASGSGITIILIAAFFGFSGIFRLDGLMSNIDSKTFARFNGNLDARSTSYIRTYMKLRLSDIGDHPTNIDTDNFIFSSKKVSTGNPIHDWYATLSASKFEELVFNNSGIKFTSVATREGNQIVFRPAKIVYSGKDFHSQIIPDDIQTKIKAAISSGNWNEVNMDNIVAKYTPLTEFFDSNKEGRQAIKQVVKENTRFFQVAKRRHIRQAIQNMTGVTNWRFFDDTRSKISEQKNAIRNKIITSMVPESTKSGKFVRCLYGISDCKFSLDPNDPANQAKGTIRNDNLIDEAKADPVDGVDANQKPLGTTEVVDYGPAAKMFRQIVGVTLGAINIANWASTLDSLDRVNSALQNHKLSKGVTIARTAQAVGLYQVLETARDQIKTGQVNGEEVGQFMQVLNSTTNNEGWSTVIAGKSSLATQASTGSSGRVFAATTDSPLTRDSYCSAEHQKTLQDNPAQASSEHTFLCPDKKIGGANNSTAIEEGYNKTIGLVIGPIIGAYHDIRHAPIIGGLVNLATSFLGKITSVATQGLIAALELGKDVEKLSLYLANEMGKFLGAGPMINCTSIDNCGVVPSGEYVNIAFEGAAATAEASARNNGANLTTPLSMGVSKNNLAIYQTETRSNQSIRDKYLSLGNPDSPVAKTAMSFSNTTWADVQSKINISSLIGSIGSSITSILSKNASAAANTGYEAANFAGIQTFDYPQRCMDLDPITAEPLDGTNALDVFAQFKITANTDNQDAFDALGSWDTESNSALFYQAIYKIINGSTYKNDSDQVAEQIYNCNLLDTVVRGGMGYTSGYTKDNGLQ